MIRKRVAASAVVLHEEGRLLLVQRAHQPDKGCWTLPGGCVEAGETLEQAVIREVAEETGLAIRVVREVGQLKVPDGDSGVYEIHDFLAERISGEAIAGDDAADIGWFAKEQLVDLVLTPDLLLYLRRYGVYP
ncbi:NUDIX hydrolase [Mesorhizobium sp. M0910]|uniref:NUDIX hydrolase n=1 Tax=Mesorhizobium sp. M0910 TaxID=2957025 RepID=UPI003335A514